eukprot:135344-Prymnesium_polylepis.1
MKFQGYRVINRPYSVTQLLSDKVAVWRAIKEDYIYIAETDHVLMHPLPNKAERGSPMAYVFNYMGPNPGYADIIERAWPDGGSSGYRRVQSIGPSPVVIHRDDLEKIAKPWEETAVALKTNNRANSALGWVIEMWGYSIAAAKIGLRHQEFADFQVAAPPPGTQQPRSPGTFHPCPAHASTARTSTAVARPSRAGGARRTLDVAPAARLRKALLDLPLHVPV